MRKRAKKVRPEGYLTEAEYQARAKEGLQRLYPGVEVETQWYPFVGEERTMYWPVVDIAVGPFATHRRYGTRYTELMLETQPFIERMIDMHNQNVEELQQPTDFHSLLDFNENARCLFCIEVEESGGRKHCLETW